MGDPDRELAQRAAGADGVFTLEDARESGLTKEQIRFRERFIWTRLYPMVFRMPGAPATWRAGIRAACIAGQPNAVLSHRTAARVYGLPGGREDMVEMTCPRWRRTQTAGLMIHETTFVPPCDVQLVDDLPIVRPERAVFELASVYRSVDFIERVLHSARRQRLITLASTRATFERLAGRGRPGVTVFRAALDRWQPLQRPTESEMETLLLQVLRRNGLPEPVLQHEVFDESARFVARVDAAYPSFRILIEYDSMQEHSDEWALTRDASRRNRLLALGYQPLTARHRDLKTGGHDLTASIRACMERTCVSNGVSQTHH
jgi:very-short-patch-repair endonuclease